jgi:hypothetical protein
MGDSGHLRKISVQYRKFNYMGDVTWCKGKVTEKLQDKGKKVVRCEVITENHRGEMTTKGPAEIELP